MNGQDEELAAAQESPTAGLDAAIDAAQTRLRGVLEEATAAARQEVDAAAAAVVERETRLQEAEATVLAAQKSVEIQRGEITERLGTAAARQRLAESRLEEASVLNDRASKTLAEALERSSVMIEEAELRIREDDARAKAMIEIQMEEARAAATAIHKRAAGRLEAVAAESEVVLKRAVERGQQIVSKAEEAAEDSRSQLGELVAHIEHVIKTVQPMPDFDLEAELAIDLRPPHTDLPVEAAVSPAPERVTETDADPVTVTEMDADPVTVTVTDADGEEAENVDEWAAAVPSAAPIADEAAMEAYFTPGEVAETEAGDDAPQQDVADAVRRAVKEWSSARQQTR